MHFISYQELYKLLMMVVGMKYHSQRLMIILKIITILAIYLKLLFILSDWVLVISRQMPFNFHMQLLGHG
jgi:hypothetical protein